MASSGRERLPKMASPEQAASMKGTASTSVVAAQRNDANGSSAMASTLAASTDRPITSTLLTGDIASMSRSTSRNDSRDDSPQQQAEKQPVGSEQPLGRKRIGKTEPQHDADHSRPERPAQHEQQRKSR